MSFGVSQRESGVSTFKSLESKEKEEHTPSACQFPGNETSINIFFSIPSSLY